MSVQSLKMSMTVKAYSSMTFITGVIPMICKS